jgi:hypothetical protein
MPVYSDTSVRVRLAARSHGLSPRQRTSRDAHGPDGGVEPLDDGPHLDVLVIDVPGLGPRENVGRLPWWLKRIARGGPVLAPGPHDLPLQYIDAPANCWRPVHA